MACYKWDICNGLGFVDMALQLKAGNNDDAGGMASAVRSGVYLDLQDMLMAVGMCLATVFDALDLDMGILEVVAHGAVQSLSLVSHLVTDTVADSGLEPVSMTRSVALVDRLIVADCTGHDAHLMGYHSRMEEGRSLQWPMGKEDTVVGISDCFENHRRDGDIPVMVYQGK